MEVEPDYLKFDISLVRNIDRNLIKRSLLETLVDLAAEDRRAGDRGGHRGGGRSSPRCATWACRLGQGRYLAAAGHGARWRRRPPHEGAPSSPTTSASPSSPRELAERGSQGIVVLDASPLERDRGRVRQRRLRGGAPARCSSILDEQRGKDYRNDDVLALDQPRGLRFLLFLDRKRRRSQPSTVGDLQDRARRA